MTLIFNDYFMVKFNDNETANLLNSLDGHAALQFNDMCAIQITSREFFCFFRYTASIENVAFTNQVCKTHGKDTTI